MAIAGAALGAAGTISKGRAAKKAGKYNAAQMEQEAVRVEMDSRRKSTAMQENAKRSLASVRARFAASGLDFVGTPMEVLAEKKFLLDSEIRESKRATSSQTRKLRAGAAESVRQGKAAFRGSLISAAGQAFSMASSFGRASPAGGGITTGSGAGSSLFAPPVPMTPQQKPFYQGVNKPTGIL